MERGKQLTQEPNCKAIKNCGCNENGLNPTISTLIVVRVVPQYL